MKTLIKYFFQGLLYVAPFAVTLYVIVEAFIILDGLIPFYFPGLGIILALAAITLIGFVGSFLIKLPLFDFFDSNLEKAPLIKLIYTSVKDLVKAFTGQKKGFNHPVLVKMYENSEIRRLGFITDESQDALKKSQFKDLVTVYLPHSFAVSGQLYLVPPSYLEPVKSKSADVMKYIIAGGVASIDDQEDESAEASSKETSTPSQANEN
ncbi:MAG: DUF502 domain-containing protein [Schleiferiaceae bacterium]